MLREMVYATPPRVAIWPLKKHKIFGLFETVCLKLNDLAIFETLKVELRAF
jgi:hypothetical protein